MIRIRKKYVLDVLLYLVAGSLVALIAFGGWNLKRWLNGYGSRVEQRLTEVEKRLERLEQPKGGK